MSDPAAPRADQAPSIFISYRRADSPGHAGWLNASLKEHFGARVRIFMDFDAIDYGEDFVEVIRRAVESSLALIVVIGRQWASASDPQTGRRRRLDDPDDIVRLEVATALARNIRVIPVLVEGATMPAPGELPADLAALSRRNAIEISDARFEFDVKRLTDALERVIPPASPPAPPPAEPEWKRRLAALPPATWLKAGALVAVAAVAFLLSNGGPVRNDDRAVNSNVNNTRPDTNGGAAADSSETETPAGEKPGRDGVQVVRVLFGGTLARGFFTPEGYIVTSGHAAKGQNEVTVVWRHGGREVRERARVVRSTGTWAADAAFLKLTRTGLLWHPTPVRPSTSLAVGEAVERYLGPDDREPGKVLKLRFETEDPFSYGGTLVTTRISSAGEAGAPVVDARGRIVAMVVGESDTETFSLPVETLKLKFLEAF